MLDNKFQCRICLEEANNTPVITICGHLYCWECLSDWIYTFTKQSTTTILDKTTLFPCPVCRRSINLNNHGEIIPIFIDNDNNSTFQTNYKDKLNNNKTKYKRPNPPPPRYSEAHPNRNIIEELFDISLNLSNFNLPRPIIQSISFLGDSLNRLLRYIRSLVPHGFLQIQHGIMLPLLFISFSSLQSFLLSLFISFITGILVNSLGRIIRIPSGLLLLILYLFSLFIIDNINISDIYKISDMFSYSQYKDNPTTSDYLTFYPLNSRR